MERVGDLRPSLSLLFYRTDQKGLQNCVCIWRMPYVRKVLRCICAYKRRREEGGWLSIWSSCVFTSKAPATDKRVSSPPGCFIKKGRTWGSFIIKPLRDTRTNLCQKFGHIINFALDDDPQVCLGAMPFDFLNCILIHNFFYGGIFGCGERDLKSTFDNRCRDLQRDEKSCQGTCGEQIKDKMEINPIRKIRGSFVWRVVDLEREGEDVSA